MCGIAGIISKDPSKTNVSVLHRMADSIAHRGPDGRAVWQNESKICGFAHLRLSIIDTSSAAAQPMHYMGRYTIIYNGELYNYIEIRETLRQKGYLFNTASDTEVILAAYDCYKNSCLDYFDGMFSFAIWDEEEQSLFCARDRFGEKPFYYYYDETENAFYFASEMKALAAAGLKRTLDQYMALQFLAHGYTLDVSDPSRTFDQRFLKLPAANYLLFYPQKNSLSLHRYWRLDKDHVQRISVADAREKFLELFNISVSRRLRSDVPLGTSLSGGLDSSSILATINKLNAAKGLKTFTAVFPGFERDEAAKAAIVSEGFGCRNYTVAPTAEAMIKDFELLMHHQEEPVNSASVYAQFRVFELARQQGVKVLLDGQGADEILAGYDKYRKWRLRTVLPGLTASLLKAREQARLMSNPELNRDFVQQFRQDEKAFKPKVKTLNDLLYFDTVQLGLEELLRYADRNSMAHGREVRLPFLNADLVSFIFSLPSNYKIHGSWTKWLLRIAMADSLPDKITWARRKIAFEPPQRVWMGEDNIVSYIQEAKRKLVKEQILNKTALDKTPAKHGAHERNGYEWRYMSLASVMP
jgi:asparagine synthase (glutamine-hydrolysing)